MRVLYIHIATASVLCELRKAFAPAASAQIQLMQALMLSLELKSNSELLQENFRFAVRALRAFPWLGIVVAHFL
jgi:hypothetical protein